jgi:ADP-ribose pyrophosphatase YjhB (NUDIX family)
LPSGKVESGEPFDVTLVREVEEETGLNVIIKGTAGGFDHKMPQVRVSSMFYDVVVTGGTLRVSA